MIETLRRDALIESPRLGLVVPQVIGIRRDGSPIYQLEGRAVSAFWYGQAILKALNKEIDYDSDTIKVTLHTSTYTPNQDTHAYVSDLTNEVANGNGYTTGGITLTTKVINYTGATNVIMLDGDDALWTSSTITARYAVISDRTPGTAATQPLLGYVDFGADKASDAGDFRITWNASGILTATAA